MRLKIPLMFVIVITMALMSSCSYAMSCAEPNLTTGILAVNNGYDEYVAVAAEMLVNLNASMDNFTLKTSSFFSSTLYEKPNAVMNVVGAIWGRNPVIIGNDVAIVNSSVNYTIRAASAQPNFIREMRSGSIEDTGEAVNATLWSNSMVKAPLDVATITQIRASRSSYGLVMERTGDIFGRHTMNVVWETLLCGQSVMPGNAGRFDFIYGAQVHSTNVDAMTECFAMHDKILVRAGDMLGWSGDIMGTINSMTKPVHDTIRVQLDSIRTKTIIDTITMGSASYA